MDEQLEKRKQALIDKNKYARNIAIAFLLSAEKGNKNTLKKSATFIRQNRATGFDESDVRLQGLMDDAEMLLGKFDVHEYKLENEPLDEATLDAYDEIYDNFLKDYDKTIKGL